MGVCEDYEPSHLITYGNKIFLYSRYCPGCGGPVDEKKTVIFENLNNIDELTGFINAINKILEYLRQKCPFAFGITVGVC